VTSTRLERRRFLHASGLLTLAAAGCRAPRGLELPPPEPYVPPPPPAPELLVEPVAPAELILPSPDFSDGNVLRYVAGIRPYRRGGFRLESEELLDGRHLVHNYGHGGAGVTLSWGCAEEVHALVRPLVARGSDIAIAGGGVMGLSCAHELLSKGHGVRIYAREFTPHTTSDLAGAQFAPSMVAAGNQPGARDRYRRIVRRSLLRFRALVGEEWGVFPRDNYATRSGGSGLRSLPEDLIPPVEYFDRLPFEGSRPPGRLVRTLLIEPPAYVPRLLAEVKEMGARIVPRTFRHRDELLLLREPVIVNCLGLGAREIASDARVQPVRGQLVHLRPQNLPYLLSHDGYVFPRRDAVVLGGTSERGIEDTRPVLATCRSILRRNARFFGKA